MHDELKIVTLPQLTAGQDWRLTLAHERDAHLLFWITRGQGRLLLDGRRRGVGTHNAILVPAGHLFSLELGRQGVGQVLVVPAGSDLQLPQTPAQLRIREVDAMSELTTLMEAATREQQKARPLTQQALEAHFALISVWLQRQMAMEEHLPERPNAAVRLTAKYCRRISDNFRSAMTMADHASALGVTPTHLTRACKAATGKTAADLLTERVLYEARALLTGTKVPAQDIARHLGFGSAAYFTHFVQHHTKTTPTTLRKQTQMRPAAA